MEAKLREYRNLRQRKELIDNAKEKLENTKQKLINFLMPKIFTDRSAEKKDEEVLLLENKEPSSLELLPLEADDSYEMVSEVSELESYAEENQESWRYCITKWTIYLTIWLTLYIFFLKVGFGAVYFGISLLVGICLNTSTKKKKHGEVSAYSVFNKNCESIDGTLKAEELEKQMIYGVASIKIF